MQLTNGSSVPVSKSIEGENVFELFAEGLHVGQLGLFVVRGEVDESVHSGALLSDITDLQ